MTTLSKREARKKHIKTTILQQAYRLFVEKGYENTTVDDILLAASTSRRTFFRYFPSKQDLLHHYSKEMVRTTRLRILDLSKNKWSTKRRLNAYFASAAESVEQANDFAQVLLRDAMASLPAITNPENTEKLVGIQEAVEELLRNGYESGELDTSYPLAFLAQMVVGIFNAVVINWINNPTYLLKTPMKRAANIAYKAIVAP